MSKADAKRAARLSDAGKVIGFCNVLIYGDAKVDHAVVWHAATRDLPGLDAEFDALLEELGESP